MGNDSDVRRNAECDTSFECLYFYAKDVLEAAAAFAKMT